MKLLLVDDEPHVLDWLKQLFDEPGEFEVYTAASGRQALELIAKTPIDIMVSDIRMPGISGFELAEQVFANWPQCHIIFLSGYAMFDYVYRANQHNVRYLLKTEDDDVILAAVRRERDAILAARIDGEEKQTSCALLLADAIKRADAGAASNVLLDMQERFADAPMDDSAACDAYREVLHVALPALAEQSLSRLISQVSHPEKCETWRQAFIMLRNAMLKALPVKNNESGESAQLFLEQVRAYIQNHLSEELSLNRIADHFFYNPSYFSRIYSQFSGENLMDYVKRARINHACDCLRKTKKSIQEITSECGFESPQYFARVFRAQTGYAPNEYRKQFLSTSRD